jgi:gliding motility-associated-like protein
VCSGSELIFKVTGNGASFVWTGPNGFYDDISYPEIYFSSLSDSGMYYVEMTTLGGCQARDSTYVTMIGTDVHAGPDTLICKGRSVQLKASRGVSYSWSPSNGLSNASVNNPLAKPDITTVYTVTVTDSDGCSDTANVRIKVINKIEVKAGISGTDYLCRSYDSASFKDISSGKIIKWNWNFDNGQTDTTAIPPVQYYLINGNENSYRIRLAVADTAGCTDTAYHFIKVEDNCYIAVPTAFTPNGDGLNDYLYPLNAYKATNLLFRVYSRNGQLVFETRDWARKWDGTVRGIQQASGVYVWMLEYNDASNKKISLKGTTALIR